MRNEDEFIRDALSGFWKNGYYWLARHIEIIRAYIVSRSLWDECIFISVGETDAWEYARYEIKPTNDVRRIFSTLLSFEIRLINGDGSGADSEERAFHDYCTTSLQRYSLPENRMFWRGRVLSTREMWEMRMLNALLASEHLNAACKNSRQHSSSRIHDHFIILQKTMCAQCTYFHFLIPR